MGPPELCLGGGGVDGIHLLLGDAALLAGLIHLGALKDHEELVVFLLGTIHRVIGLRGRLLGLALLAKGATDVALHGGTVLEEMPILLPVEWVGGLKRLLEVFQECTAPMGLRSGGEVSRGHHLLPVVVLVLVLLIAASLGQGRIIAAVATTKVASGLDFPTEVGLDHLLTGGIWVVTSRSSCVVLRVSWPSAWTRAS